MIDKREEWAQRMGLKYAGKTQKYVAKAQLKRRLPLALIDQLENCRCEEARRLILGVSRHGDQDRKGAEWPPITSRE